MKLTVTEVSLHPQNESPIFGETVTRLRLADEGGGMFVSILQYQQETRNEIRLGFDEVAELVKAVDFLKQGVLE
jgi:hypothetical protein